MVLHGSFFLGCIPLYDIIDGVLINLLHIRFTSFADFENKEIFYYSHLLIMDLDIILPYYTDLTHGWLAIFTKIST
jgi:hypothetical protein